MASGTPVGQYAKDLKNPKSNLNQHLHGDYMGPLKVVWKWNGYVGYTEDLVKLGMPSAPKSKRNK
jgi:hypothetical protein